MIVVDQAKGPQQSHSWQRMIGKGRIGGHQRGKVLFGRSFLIVDRSLFLICCAVEIGDLDTAAQRKQLNLTGRSADSQPYRIVTKVHDKGKLFAGLVLARLISKIDFVG
jgi:hypothetical protein